MTWQDELRQLDEELAAGRLSAEDYRRQRDELLSQSASTAGPSGSPPPVSTPAIGQPAQPPQPVQPPQQQQPPGGPFPPPFRWDQAPPESTQVMGQIGEDANGGSDTTQVVPGAPRPPGMPPQSGMPPQAAGMPPQTWGVPPQAGGMPPVPGWPQEQAPPWGGMDLPTTDTTPGWFKQGPEVFEAGGGSRTVRILGVIGVVALLIGISVGAYYLFRPDTTGAGGGGGGGATAAPTSTQSSAPPTTTSTKPEGPPIAELPGTATDASRVKTFADVEAVGYLTNQEIDAYHASNAGMSKMAISNSGDSRIIVLITQQADPAGAAKTRDALNDLQLRFKLSTLQAQPGVLSAGLDNADPGPLRRAHYASGRYVVRIQVQGIDKAEVDRLYSEVLGTQLDELPADA